MKIRIGKIIRERSECAISERSPGLKPMTDLRFSMEVCGENEHCEIAPDMQITHTHTHTHNQKTETLFSELRIQ